MKWVRLIDKPDITTLRYEGRQGPEGRFPLHVEIAKFSRWDCLIKCRESDLRRLNEAGIRWETPTK